MTDSISTAVVWFDRDLRLRDHPALAEAADRADAVVPLFVFDDEERKWSRGDPQRWWLARSLASFQQRLVDRDLRLTLRQGAAPEVVATVAADIDADAVFWSRRFGAGCSDRAVEEALEETPAAAEPHEGRLLHDPDAVETTSGGPYHVYTPFWNKFRDVVDIDSPEPVPNLDAELAPDSWPASAELDDLVGASPQADLDDYWEPGARQATERLENFIADGLSTYESGRDRLDIDGTSRLSPYLHFGEISPRQVWRRIVESEALDEHPDATETFLQEIVWREFSHHLLHHYPETDAEPLRDKFRAFEWHDNAEFFERWRDGRTGFPVVDAGMRQLRDTGWMHNRARMIVASFLTKDLLIPWQQGADWFWNRLVDADLANNSMGWQWAAGCGADAQPFFRIFNPIKQGERHDPDAAYIQRWVPELRDLEPEVAHRPWDHDGAAAAYPERIVDHGRARERALEAWEAIK